MWVWILFSLHKKNPSFKNCMLCYLWLIFKFVWSETLKCDKHAKKKKNQDVYVCVYIYIYIYIYTHTHTHTHMHACIQVHLKKFEYREKVSIFFGNIFQKVKLSYNPNSGNVGMFFLNLNKMKTKILEKNKGAPTMYWVQKSTYFKELEHFCANPFF